MALPEKIQNLVELTPFEEVMLFILRREFEPEVSVQSLVAHDQQFPFILVRRGPGHGLQSGDPRFVDVGTIVVHTFAEGLDCDDDASDLAEAVRVTLRDAWLHNEGDPSIGYLAMVRLVSGPRKAPDWMTAMGPVQYADLPHQVARYETEYQIAVRKPRPRRA